MSSDRSNSVVVASTAPGSPTQSHRSSVRRQASGPTSAGDNNKTDGSDANGDNNLDAPGGGADGRRASEAPRSISAGPVDRLKHRTRSASISGRASATPVKPIIKHDDGNNSDPESTTMTASSLSPRGSATPPASPSFNAENRVRIPSLTASTPTQNSPPMAGVGSLSLSVPATPQPHQYQARGSGGKIQFSIASTIPVHSATEKEFTAFMVTIHFPSGETKTILRRYRQFAALHAAVSKKFPDQEIPAFPKKRILGNMNPSLVEKRRCKLEKYVQTVASFPGIEDFPGFTTFLGSEIAGPRSGSGKLPGTPAGKKKDGSSPSPLSASSGSIGSPIDDPEETPEEKEQRMLMERRYGEVKHCVTTLEGWISRLLCIEKSFDSVTETPHFIKFSDYSKLVVALGKMLSSEPTEVDFIPRELPEEQAALIANPKIRSIRQKITPAVSELISKVSKIKTRLLDLDIPMEKVLELQQLVEDLREVWDGINLVPNALGFRIEAGTPSADKKLPEYIADNICWYMIMFVGHDHIICHTPNSPQLGPVVVAIKAEEFSETTGKFRGYICTKDGNDHVMVTVNGTDLANTWIDKYQDILLQMDSRLRGAEWKLCSGHEAEKWIQEYERKDMRITRRLKFGILYCKKDQTSEEQMFNNQENSAEFEEFLGFMGEKILLSGWKGFAGGLDVRGENTTGAHSMFRQWRDFQVMYHVSTMLPHGESAQQLAKKRHIGNDIVMVVFQDEGSQPFSATTVKSNYIQITIVVRVINLGDGKRAWRVTVASAQDVPEFGPPLPYPPIFDNGDDLGDWICQKMINGELGAYRSKLFVQQFRSTFKTLVTELQGKLPPQTTLKVNSKNKGFFSPFAKRK